MRLRSRPAVAVLIAVVAVTGIILRIWIYRRLLGTPNADEAVMGLMARHVLHGEFTTFYWGQPYGGPQEVYATVPLFWVFGSGWLALRIVPIVINAVACLVVWRVGRRTIGEPGATIAGALLWVWPPFTIAQLIHQSGFYASDVLYPPLLVLLALRVADRPTLPRTALLGFVFGLSVWETSQIVPVAIGIVAWLVWKAPRALHQAPAAAAAAILGGLPWVVWNLTHGFNSLNQAKGSMPLQSLRLLASPMLPMTVGLRSPFSGTLLIPSKALTYLVELAIVALFLVGAVRSRNRQTSVLYLVIVAFPWLYMLAPYTAGVTGNPRYLTVIVPVLVLLACALVRSWAVGAALLALATFVSAVTLNALDGGRYDSTNNWHLTNYYATGYVLSGILAGSLILTLTLPAHQG